MLNLELKEDAICLMRYKDKNVLTCLIEDWDPDGYGDKPDRIAMRHYGTKGGLDDWWYEYIHNIIKIITPEKDPEYFI